MEIHTIGPKKPHERYSGGLLYPLLMVAVVGFAAGMVYDRSGPPLRGSTELVHAVVQAPIAYKFINPAASKGNDYCIDLKIVDEKYRNQIAHLCTSFFNKNQYARFHAGQNVEAEVWQRPLTGTMMADRINDHNQKKPTHPKPKF